MNILKVFLNHFGRYLEKSTSSNDIFKLIKKMKPVSINKKLIRLGDDNDGGYVVPNDFKEVKFCFSAGVGNLIKFEQDCLNKFNIKSFLCDYNNIKNPRIINCFDFTKKKISVINTNDNLTLNKWIKNKNINDNEFILKIDIEGSEYETLLNISDENLQKTRILIVEFHRLRDIRNVLFYQIFNSVLDRLLDNFYIVHLHPNNAGKNIKIHEFNIPDLMEITFIKKNRVKKKSKKHISYPLSIDQKCVLEKEDIFLDTYWYK